jgi:hypothetical protein
MCTAIWYWENGGLWGVTQHGSCMENKQMSTVTD